MASFTRRSVTVSIHPPGAHRECDSPAVATTIAFEAVTSARSEGTMKVAAFAVEARRRAKNRVARLPSCRVADESSCRQLGNLATRQPMYPPRIVNDDIDAPRVALMTSVTSP